MTCSKCRCLLEVFFRNCFGQEPILNATFPKFMINSLDSVSKMSIVSVFQSSHCKVRLSNKPLYAPFLRSTKITRWFRRDLKKSLHVITQIEAFGLFAKPRPRYSLTYSGCLIKDDQSNVDTSCLGS